jgi:hypothetical protein
MNSCTSNTVSHKYRNDPAKTLKSRPTSSSTSSSTSTSASAPHSPLNISLLLKCTRLEGFKRLTRGIAMEGIDGNIRRSKHIHSIGSYPPSDHGFYAPVNHKLCGLDTRPSMCFRCRVSNGFHPFSLLFLQKDEEWTTPKGGTEGAVKIRSC